MRAIYNEIGRILGFRGLPGFRGIHGIRAKAAPALSALWNRFARGGAPASAPAPSARSRQWTVVDEADSAALQGPGEVLEAESVASGEERALLQERLFALLPALTRPGAEPLTRAQLRLLEAHGSAAARLLQAHGGVAAGWQPYPLGGVWRTPSEAEALPDRLVEFICRVAAALGAAGDAGSIPILEALALQGGQIKRVHDAAHRALDQLATRVGDGYLRPRPRPEDTLVYPASAPATVRPDELLRPDKE